jgi:hypothetical protein
MFTGGLFLRGKDDGMHWVQCIRCGCVMDLRKLVESGNYEHNIWERCPHCGLEAGEKPDWVEEGFEGGDSS